jgi:hypothetical protein
MLLFVLGSFLLVLVCPSSPQEGLSCVQELHYQQMVGFDAVIVLSLSKNENRGGQTQRTSCGGFG